MRLQTQTAKEISNIAVALAAESPTPPLGFPPIDECIARGLKLFDGGLGGISESCQLFAQAYKYYPEFVDRLVEARPRYFTHTFVHKLIAVGQKRVMLELLLEPSTAGTKALLKAPRDTQEKYFQEPIPVVLENGDILNTDVRALSPLQVRQVFDGDRIRTDAEQRAWIENKKLQNAVAPIPHDVPWRVVGDELVFMEAGRISLKECAKLAAEAMK